MRRSARLRAAVTGGAHQPAVLLRVLSSDVLLRIISLSHGPEEIVSFRRSCKYLHGLVEDAVRLRAAEQQLVVGIVSTSHSIVEHHCWAEILRRGSPNQVFAAGAYHLAFVNTAGRLFTCGMDSDDQQAWGEEDFLSGVLGHGGEEFFVDVPKSIAQINVRSVACGYAHTLALDSTGAVHSFGWGMFGQLGLGDSTDRVRPARIELLANTVAFHGRVCAVAAQAEFSMVITTRGTLFTFGQLDDDADQWNDEPLQIHFDPNAQVRVCSVTRSGPHCLAATANGAVFHWSNNYQPVRVAGLQSKRVATVAACVDRPRCMALTVDGEALELVWDGREDLPHTFEAKPVAALQGRDLCSLAASSDGEHLVAVSTDGTIFVSMNNDDTPATEEAEWVAPSRVATLSAVRSCAVIDELNCVNFFATTASGSVHAWRCCKDEEWAGQLSLPPWILRPTLTCTGGVALDHEPREIELSP